MTRPTIRTSRTRRTVTRALVVALTGAALMSSAGCYDTRGQNTENGTLLPATPTDSGSPSVPGDGGRIGR